MSSLSRSAAHNGTKPTPASGLLLSLLLAAVFSGGCSTTAQPQMAVDRSELGAGKPPEKPLPLEDITGRLDNLSDSEAKAQLYAIIDAGGESDVARQEAAYVLARLLQKNADAKYQQEALRLFEIAAGDEPLRERAQWHISECAAALGQEKVVRKALADIKEHAQKPEDTAAADYALAQSYLRANESDKARTTFQGIRKEHPETQYALGSAYYLGEMLVDNPETRDEGIALFRQYLRKSPDGHFARNIVGRLSQLPEFKPSAEDRDSFGQVNFVHGEFAQALDNWKSAGGDKRWYERAVCLLRLGRTAEAKAALSQGLKTHPNDGAVPEAAQSLCRLLTRDQAVAVWQDLLRSSTAHGDQALWNLAIRSSPPQSISYYRQIVEKYPRSDYAPESAWWNAWDLVRQGKSTQAIAACEKGLKDYPSSRAAPRFSYWAGKLHERAGKKDLAKAAYLRTSSRFGSHYYGHRAASRLAALAGGKDRGWATSPPRQHPSTGWSWPNPPQLMAWQEIARRVGTTEGTLARLGQWEECLQLLPQDADPIIRSWLMAKLDLPLDAINTATQGLDGKPGKGVSWQLSYPLLYAGTVASESKAKGVDPLLVHALIREESRYNHLALSRSNAIGLMQLLPATAYGVAKRLGVSLTGNQDIYRPEHNIKLGTDYLSYGIRRTQGNAMFAVAGYNGGPNAVRAWAGRFSARGLSDYDIFVEDIPYQETRDYVRKVFGSYWNYEAIYGHGKS